MSMQEGIIAHIKNLFFRERILHIFKAVALVAYQCGLGYGLVARVLEALSIKVSATSVRNWVMKCESIEINPNKIRRTRIAVDETIVVINKAKYYVWIVVDIATEEILAFHVSKGATIFDAVYVVKEALQHCKGKPRVFTDDGSFYGSALRILRLKQTIVCFGPRSSVERAFSRLGPRMEIIGKGYRNSPAEFMLSWLRRWVTAFMNLGKVIERSLS